MTKWLIFRNSIIYVALYPGSQSEVTRRVYKHQGNLFDGSFGNYESEERFKLGDIVTPLFNSPAVTSIDLHITLIALPTMLQMPCIPSVKLRSVYVTFISQYSMSHTFFLPPKHGTLRNTVPRLKIKLV